MWGKTEVENMGQVVGHPLSDIRNLAGFRSPDYTDASRYVGVATNLDKMEAQGKYILGNIFMVLFERMHSLHGFENTLVDLYTDRPAMEAMADMIVETHVTLVRTMASRFPGRIQGWNMSNDWGT